MRTATAASRAMKAAATAISVRRPLRQCLYGLWNGLISGTGAPIAHEADTRDANGTANGAQTASDRRQLQALLPRVGLSRAAKRQDRHVLGKPPFGEREQLEEELLRDVLGLHVGARCARAKEAL